MGVSEKLMLSHKLYMRRYSHTPKSGVVPTTEIQNKISNICFRIFELTTLSFYMAATLIAVGFVYTIITKGDILSLLAASTMQMFVFLVASMITGIWMGWVETDST